MNNNLYKEFLEQESSKLSRENKEVRAKIIALEQEIKSLKEKVAREDAINEELIAIYEVDTAPKPPFVPKTDAKKMDAKELVASLKREAEFAAGHACVKAFVDTVHKLKAANPKKADKYWPYEVIIAKLHKDNPSLKRYAYATIATYVSICVRTGILLSEFKVERAKRIGYRSLL